MKRQRVGKNDEICHTVIKRLRHKASKLSMLVFRGNAFLNFMKDATPKEQDWAKTLFLTTNVSSKWIWANPTYLVLWDCDKDKIVFDIGYNGAPIAGVKCSKHGKRYHSKVISRYFWIHQDDHTFDRFTPDILQHVLKFLTDVNDMYNCMFVSKVFFKAATRNCLYKYRIKRLLNRAQMLKNPFYAGYSNIPLYKQFYILALKSSYPDVKLFDKWISHMSTPGNGVFLWYFGNILNGWGFLPFPKCAYVEYGKQQIEINNTTFETIVRLKTDYSTLMWITPIGKVYRKSGITNMHISAFYYFASMRHSLKSCLDK